MQRSEDYYSVGRGGRDGSAPTGHFGGGGYGHFGILISFQIMDIYEHLHY